MNSQSISSWIQAVTGIGVLVGVGLVVLELRQTHAFMESELRRSDFNTQMAIRRSELGENPMIAYEKACLGKEPLSVMDVVILESYFQLLMNGSLHGPVGYALLDVDPGSWRVFATVNLGKMFRLSQGRDYFTDSFAVAVEKRPPEKRSNAVNLVYEIGTALLQHDFGTCVEASSVRFETMIGP